MRKYFFLLTVLASAIMAGCSSKECNTPSCSNNGLSISASLGSSASTRSLITEFDTGNQIGIFVNGTGYSPMVATYTKSSSNIWTSPALTTNKIYLSDQTATVYGFYPSTATATLTNDGSSNIGISVDSTDSFNAINQNDYMYATGESIDGGATFPAAIVSNAVGADSAKLVFHHALSEMSFIVNLASDYSGKGSITDIKLTSTDASNPFNTGAGTMLVSNGTFTFGSSSASVEFTGNATCNAYNATPSTTPVAVQLVAPKTTTANITLCLTIDGKLMSTTLPTTATSWSAGSNYIYTITVKNSNELIANGVSINPWNNVVGGNGTVY
jgi:hypothetical protein